MNAARATGEDVIELFRVLGHSQRMALLRALADGERGVAELASASGIAQPALSQQLAILRKADLVQTRRKAKQVFYSLAPQTFARLGGAIDSLCPRRDPCASDVSPPQLGRGPVGAAMFARIQPRG